MKIREIFLTVAVATAIFSSINLVAALLTGNVFGVISGILGLIGAFAWYLISELSEEVYALGRELHKLKKASTS